MAIFSTGRLAPILLLLALWVWTVAGVDAAGTQNGSTSGAGYPPSYRHGFARSAAESDAPDQWVGLSRLWIPRLGPSGSVIRDWARFKWHATILGITPAAAWVATDRGPAIQVAGSGHADATTPASGRTAVTIAAWVRPSSIGTNRAIWSTKDRGPLFQMHTSTLQFWSDTDAANGSSATLTWSANNWYHVAVTYANGGTAKFYLNGLDVSSTSPTADIRDNINDYVGSWVGTSRQFQGAISEVRVYNRVLAPAQILEMYQDPDAIIRLRAPIVGSVAAAAEAGTPAAVRQPGPFWW